MWVSEKWTRATDSYAPYRGHKLFNREGESIVGACETKTNKQNNQWNTNTPW